MTGQIDVIKELCVSGKRVELLAEVRRALASGMPAQEVMLQGLIPAMSVVGQKYSLNEFFLPQMMLAARAMQEALGLLKSHLVQGGIQTRGKAVIGTVAGDYHDIGKNIVKLMLEGAGYEVVDLGVDTNPERFVDAVRRESPRFVLLSALITLTMQNMRKTIEALRAAGLREGVVVGVGGAPLTKRFADEIGADFYSEDAHQCVLACNGWPA